MRRLRLLLTLLALLVLAPVTASIVQAADNDPLFVNLTTDSAHRASMALVFAQNQAEKKHPVTIFLNDRGVLLAAKAHARKYAPQQSQLLVLLKSGATVLICPMCMKHYGVSQANLIDGLKVGNPEMTGAALFRDGTKTLSW